MRYPDFSAIQPVLAKSSYTRKTTLILKGKKKKKKKNLEKSMNSRSKGVETQIKEF